jgi:hypothetical protein
MNELKLSKSIHRFTFIYAVYQTTASIASLQKCLQGNIRHPAQQAYVVACGILSVHEYKQLQPADCQKVGSCNYLGQVSLTAECHSHTVHKVSPFL